MHPWGRGSTACHAEGRGFESLQPLSKKACICRSFSWTQSAGASASPDNDWTIVSVATRMRDRKVLFSRRFRATSTLELLRPCSGSTSTAPGRCSCPSAPLRLLRGRNAAFVEEQHSQPALLLVVRRASARRLGGDPRFSTGGTFLPRSPRVQLAWESNTVGSRALAPTRECRKHAKGVVRLRASASWGAAGRESGGGPASVPRPELLERLRQAQAGVSRARGRAARRAGARGRSGGGVGGARARVAAATGPWAAGAAALVQRRAPLARRARSGGPGGAASDG